MKNLLLSLSICFFSWSLSAQIGLSGNFSTIGTSGWEDVKEGENVLAYNSGFTYALDYWFRLKDFRVEFLPELSYGRFDNLPNGNTLVPLTLNSDLDIYAFSFNTHIYIFDLEGDCDCPTWGKEGGVFKKGFYLMAGPGISRTVQNDLVAPTQVFTTEIFPSEVSTNATRLTASVGVGLDIGITKSITLTPFGRFKWHSSATWDGIASLAVRNLNEDDYPDFDSSITQLQAGLRLSYRWGEY